jgi:uncharacterized repeat protein (TIGR03803 family)
MGDIIMRGTKQIRRSNLFVQAAGAALGFAAASCLALGLPPSAQAQTYKDTVLYSFAGTPDGVSPVAGLARDSAGNFYGATNTGGTFGMGTVFKLATTGEETVLHDFAGGTDGELPYGGVILGINGNLYGTASFGGASNKGIIFEVNPASGKEKIIYNFSGGSDGALPYAGLVSDAQGNLYGTTLEGGDPGCNSPEGCGTVFRASMNGAETVLYSFTGPDGERPQDSLILDSKHNLYGTAELGGSSGDGVVFEVTLAGVETVLHNFTGGTDGTRPLASVVRDSIGNLYGATSMGGSSLSGIVFKVDTSNNETVLYTFLGGADGQYPYAGLVRDSQGNLYGTTIFGGTDTFGVVFELDTAGKETVLHSFQGSDGEYPVASLLMDAKGGIYSTTELGGAHNMGEVFKLTP